MLPRGQLKGCLASQQPLSLGYANPAPLTQGSLFSLTYKENAGVSKGAKAPWSAPPEGRNEPARGSRVSKYAGGIFVAEYEVRQHRLLGNAERFFQKYWRAERGLAKQIKSLSHTKRAETCVFLPFDCP